MNINRKGLVRGAGVGVATFNGGGPGPGCDASPRPWSRPVRSKNSATCESGGDGDLWALAAKGLEASFKKMAGVAKKASRWINKAGEGGDYFGSGQA